MICNEFSDWWYIHYSYSYSNSGFKSVFNSSFIYQKMLGDVTATIICCCDKVSLLKFKKSVWIFWLMIYGHDNKIKSGYKVMNNLSLC
jgi:hypothetical protein